MSSEPASLARSLALVRERVEALPSWLQQAPRVAALDGAIHWHVTGAGGSEGPARVLVDALGERGVHARFVPLSSYALERPRADGLVVFSQSLSPNARIALDRRHAYRRRVLVSAADAALPDVELVRHPPASEGALLVRLIGPTLATLMAFQLAGHDAEPEAIAAAVAATGPRPGVDGPLALIVAGGRGARSHGLRWKLLEALGVADPPIWDVLQVAHGPFQQFYDGRVTLLALTRGDDGTEAELFDRLEATLVPERHVLRRIEAHLDPPWGWFEHDAALNQIVLATLTAAPRDLIEWPGKGHDEPLFTLSSPPR